MAIAGILRPSGHFRAILTMSAGVACLVANDAFAKILTETYSVVEISFLRNILALPIILTAIASFVGVSALSSRHIRLHAFRGLLVFGASVCFFLGLKVLPLAEATALIFVSPIFITALSVPLLGEHVGWRRWSAVAVGFVGMLIIVQPGAAAFQPASLLVVAGALFYALVMLSTRWVHLSESTWTLMLYTVLFTLLYSSVVVPFVWVTPALADIPLFLGMAVFGTIGVTLISHAFRLAPAAVVAPFDYTALIWASVLGWIVWNEVPGFWVYGGALVIIASGLFIVIRERDRTPHA
jgi:drug/metabolite transporter (DMT)-like permease